MQERGGEDEVEKALPIEEKKMLKDEGVEEKEAKYIHPKPYVPLCFSTKGIKGEA